MGWQSSPGRLVVAAAGLLGFVNGQAYFGTYQDTVTKCGSDNFIYLGCYGNFLANAGDFFRFGPEGYNAADLSLSFPGWDPGSDWDSTQTPLDCARTCRAYGYKYSAMRDNNCNCGLQLPAAAAPNSDTSACNAQCSGDSTQTCGGGLNAQVYLDPSFAAPDQVPITPRNADLGSTYKHLGCYSSRGFATQDDVRARPLVDDIETCFETCAGLGYPLVFGAREGAQIRCQCGTNFHSGDYRIPPSSLPNPGDCNALCTADDTSELQGCYVPRMPGLKQSADQAGFTCYNPPSSLLGTPKVLTTSLSSVNQDNIIVSRPALVRPLTVTTGTQTWYLNGCYGNVPAQVLDLSATSGQIISDLATGTLEECARRCSSDTTFNYFGMVNGRDCYCSNSLLTPGQVDDMGTCRVPCKDDATRSCGGATTPVVYSLSQSGVYTERLANIGAGFPTYTCTPSRRVSNDEAAPISCPDDNGVSITTAQDKMYHVDCGIEYPDGDLGTVIVDSYAECAAACDTTTDCVGFIYQHGPANSNGLDAPCYLKREGAITAAVSADMGNWGGRFTGFADGSSSGSDSGTGSGSDSGSGTDPDSGSGSGSGTDPDSGSGSGSGTDPDSGSGSGSGTDPDSGSGSGSGTDPDSGSGSGDGSDPGTGSGSGSGDGSDPGTGSGSGSGDGSDPGTGSGSGSGSGDGSDPGSGSGSGSNTGSGSGSGSGNGSGSGTGSGSVVNAIFDKVFGPAFQGVFSSFGKIFDNNPFFKPKKPAGSTRAVSTSNDDVQDLETLASDPSDSTAYRSDAFIGDVLSNLNLGSLMSAVPGLEDVLGGQDLGSLIPGNIRAPNPATPPITVNLDELAGLASTVLAALNTLPSDVAAPGPVDTDSLITLAGAITDALTTAADGSGPGVINGKDFAGILNSVFDSINGIGSIFPKKSTSSSAQPSMTVAPTQSLRARNVAHIGPHPTGVLPPGNGPAEVCDIATLALPANIFAPTPPPDAGRCIPIIGYWYVGETTLLPCSEGYGAGGPQETGSPQAPGFSGGPGGHPSPPSPAGPPPAVVIPVAGSIVLTQEQLDHLLESTNIELEWTSEGERVLNIPGILDMSDSHSDTFRLLLDQSSDSLSRSTNQFEIPISGEVGLTQSQLDSLLQDSTLDIFWNSQGAKELNIPGVINYSSSRNDTFSLRISSSNHHTTASASIPGPTESSTPPAAGGETPDGSAADEDGGYDDVEAELDALDALIASFGDIDFDVGDLDIPDIDVEGLDFPTIPSIDTDDLDVDVDDVDVSRVEEPEAPESPEVPDVDTIPAPTIDVDGEVQVGLDDESGVPVVDPVDEAT
ncbi:hypothetical protein NEUTE1DRAFT_89724 [Neurospora tetrasperma FGSC 2508]|uniref:WSC domain-containing protein n=1 Tax=Neurospora tetrasperma (strain FGSC 2508 / ATCC MYA-4615 / P0657) TaxID=510951 RepID=F8N4S9_NEUT8|nr:uncharacterized protein NEUTE1DRAFT_89724 [Neurospora tetrasperma FGSC 2508]EGO51916.1 hypothetical protein NEUTE1DRAFT_89724 [Neurospora tetrasperma FGSC 2508]